MSQHFFETSVNGQPATILMGFDRPLQGYFMVVEQDGANEDGILYSNLTDPALQTHFGLPASLDHFKAKLFEMGLSVPQRMIEEVEADASANVGNRIAWYDEQANIMSEKPIDGASRPQREHQFFSTADLVSQSVLYRLVAEGGLRICKVCRGSVGELPTHCPGEVMTAEQREGVHAKKLDHREGRWFAASC